MLNGRTELHIFDRGSVTGDRYCEKVLLPHVRLFRGAIGPDFIFMDDNVRPHRTLSVEELLESEDITRMDWPAYSPDLNPIENVWDDLGRCIAARLHHLENTQQLKQMLIEEWALLPQEMLHQLVLKRPPEKEPPSTSNSFMRIGSLNLRKARKSTVFASVRGGNRNRNSLTDMRFGSHASMRKKLHKSMPPLEKKSEFEKKNDSDSDSNYGFPSKKQDS
ncbi:transposable element Tcb2 transposase [Trichonephila clavipes]|uniref:Transposable element Tcb2 transposase n=1 Tax=Trichonephila clavipes TaxID=2585209 RepID=A0A8X6UT60_TRICX|nr:transposable element Tcb2 transposase [Trichonephila clavipes]